MIQKMINYKFHSQFMQSMDLTNFLLLFMFYYSNECISHTFHLILNIFFKNNSTF